MNFVSLCDILNQNTTILLQIVNSFNHVYAHTILDIYQREGRLHMHPVLTFGPIRLIPLSYSLYHPDERATGANGQGSYGRRDRQDPSCWPARHIADTSSGSHRDYEQTENIIK